MFKTNEILLKTLLSDVAGGKIQLPDFQRGWVWEDDRIRNLLASISRRFPIGVVMTLSSGGDINFKPRLIEGVGQEGDYNASTRPESFLLDGQQRLTSLYQALLHPGPVETQDNRKQKIQRRYYIDMRKAMNPNIDRVDAIVGVPGDRKITRDFGREIILNLSSEELEYEQHMMPTERLWDSIPWMLGYIGYWEYCGAQHPNGSATKFFESFNNSVMNNFTSYQIPVITLEKETPKEAVCAVFENVNQGGVTLTVFELVTASFAADAGDEHFSLREDWDSRKNQLRSSFGVLQGIEGDQFLQAVALLTTQERRRQAVIEGRPPNQTPGIGCSRNDVLNLSLQDYKRWADKVQTGFLNAAKFLNTQYVFTKDNVPYNTQLVPLAALYVELDSELNPANAKARLERWYWSGIFGEVYAGNTDTQFALDLPEVAEYIRGGAEPRSITESNFIPQRLLSLRTRNSAAYKGLYALQKKSGAADWRTGEALALATLHDSNIDIHHIFPVDWCQKKSNPPVPRPLYDSVVNKTPIDSSTNKIVGGRSPSEYLARLQHDINPETLDRVLRSHWLNPELLRADNFAECFIERGEAMMELIGEAMGKSLPSGREVFHNGLTFAGLGENIEQTGLLEPPEDFDETDIEYDSVGDMAYADEREAAD